MTPEEIIDKVIEDAMRTGSGFVYIDPKKFWKQPPWYKRFWRWMTQRKGI